MRFLTLSAFATLLSATAFGPAFAADLGTYRPGTPYNSSVAAGADVCDSQCAGDAQCRGWNYVKPNPQAPGVCEYLSTVSAPISSQISISGENISAAPYSPRVTSGGTNTIRVGTQVARPTNTVSVGQTPPARRVVRQAVPQRATAQRASTQAVENMSLTAQQNRYRQGQTAQPQAPIRPAVPQQASRQAIPAQRPMFRPILDAPSAAMQRQSQRGAQPKRQSSRRMTGPRNAVPPMPYSARPQSQRPVPRAAQPQGQMMARGSSRPPVGQPIAPPQSAMAQSAMPQQPVRQPPSTPSQRLAQLTAQTQTTSAAAAPKAETQGPVALTPQQARKSLFGSLNDDLRAPAASGAPGASAVPTTPVTQQELGPVLAGGL